MASVNAIAPPVAQPVSSSWLETPKQVLSTIGSVAKSAIDELVTALSNIKDNPSALVKSIKLIGLGIMAYRIKTGNSTWQQPVASRINSNINLIDTFGIFDDANYFISGKHHHKNTNFFDTLSAGFFLKAGVGGLMLWLDEIRLTNFAKWSESIGGNSRYFGTSLTAAAGLGYAAMGLSAIYRLKQESHKPMPNQTRMRHNLVELAWATAEVVSKSVLLLAAANVITVGGLGLIALSAAATSIGIISFVHGRRFANQINEA